MRKTIMQVVVAMLVAAGGLTATAAPAQAGGWITMSFYYPSELPQCEADGRAKVAAGYTTYWCAPGFSGSRPVAAERIAGSATTQAVACDRCGTRGFWLRLYIS
ncbi:hypothetical protein ACLQ3H_21225 [Micromonospora saelicesensis]|uniref:hypothetical protein n=1 Tax=Micromonospora saelicesensis TaxID=285676 RepID=UPI003CE80D87